MSGSDVHVRPLAAGWEVRREGERYPTSRHRTRFSAVKNARLMAVDSRSTLLVHELDGQITLERAVARSVAMDAVAGVG